MDDADKSDEREEELSTLSAIYPELTFDPQDQFCVSLDLAVTPATPLLVRFVPSISEQTVSKQSYAQAIISAAYIEHDVELAHLPPLQLCVTLYDGYPENVPPKVALSTKHGWLPKSKLGELEQEVVALWEEYGHCQILFAYIDHLQQAAERGFDLDQSAEGCLVLPVTAESKLVKFDVQTRQAIFDAGSFDCGICLEPKKGSSCYQLNKCSHVFCRQCLQDFFNNAITEGDVAGVRCLSPDCGKDSSTTTGRKRRRKTERTLHPRELLAMGIEESMVRRYVEMKRKKKLEADKTTVYCPRTWCQGPARSAKYPPIPADLSTYVATEVSSDEESDAETADKHDVSQKPKANPKIPPDPSDRLAICEKCSLAFCKVCFTGWHGPFARCYPRDPSELSAEEKASYDYIRLNTSPCPYCCSPTQKTMGCNHMNCFNCGTHFCYLCGSWLDSQNPYQHFNKAGTPCYQRLWELEEGDEGQAPADGAGFAGGRGWEQMAIEAAREAEAQEAAALAEETRAEEDIAFVIPPAPNVPPVVRMAQMQINEVEPPDLGRIGAPLHIPNRGGRRRNNAARVHPAPGAANAVRNHERGQPRRNGRARPALNAEDRQAQELQRFLEMAQRDEEDGWDSDELADGDAEFVIR